MQKNFWPSSEFAEAGFATTRDDALSQMGKFAAVASRYAKQRNFVVPGNTNVSRLSPAIRHRLISEREVAATVLKKYAFSTVEKFLQEIYWRRYWKSWLRMRPQVWESYLDDLKLLQRDSLLSEQVLQVSSGNSAVQVMNIFANELRETGYMHNHARMWFAAYWIHTVRLPWQLGADFFYRHLLDADAASNTLSWRWVAGLQTPGKSYLARRSNIEKFLNPELLEGNTEGLDLLEDTSAISVEGVERLPACEPENRTKDFLENVPTALWVHDEDLSVELVLPDHLRHPVSNIVITEDMETAEDVCFSKEKRSWLREALGDAVQRCSQSFELEVDLLQSKNLVSDLLKYLKQRSIKQLLAYRPEVGYLASVTQHLEKELERQNINLVWLVRDEDLAVEKFGKTGFFGFWKKVKTYVKSIDN